MDTVYEKQMRAKQLKKELKAKYVFVDYRYDNRMVPLFSDAQKELVAKLIPDFGTPEFGPRLYKYAESIGFSQAE